MKYENGMLQTKNAIKETKVYYFEVLPKFCLTSAHPHVKFYFECIFLVAIFNFNTDPSCFAKVCREKIVYGFLKMITNFEN